MDWRSWFRTDRLWIFFTFILIVAAVAAILWVDAIGGFGPGQLWDMLPHFLSGAALCAFLLNFNISRTKQKLTPLAAALLIAIPAIIYTLVLGFAWELIEEAIEHFMPWVPIYAQFFWNGVRDLIMDLLGAALSALLYLWHFPAIQEPRPPHPSHPVRSQEPLPGLQAMNYCANCGSVVPADAEYCPACGEKV